MLDARAHSFTNRPVDLTGNFVDNHKVWTIHSVAYDNTIQAGRSALVRYEFHIPADVKGPLTITARVNYRHLRQNVPEQRLRPGSSRLSRRRACVAHRTLNIGDNPATPALPNDNPDWMRWNNCRHRLSRPVAVRRCDARLRAGREAAPGLQGRLHQRRPHLHRVGEIR